RFTPAPSTLEARDACFELALPPKGEATFHWTVVCNTESTRHEPLPFTEARDRAVEALARAQADGCTVQTSKGEFNAWFDRSVADLYMMITETPVGPYPYAGVPWFSTPFGRDGIITALESLWLNPDVARGVLSFLAATQATEVNPAQDAEPGKILHETRSGEMAALGEVPFGHYYGSVDATPLFVLLAGAYFERTADQA